MSLGFYDGLHSEVEIRLECARIAVGFFPLLSDGVRISEVCDIVYNWVTQGEVHAILGMKGN